MNAAVLTLIVLACFFLGYHFYSHFIATHIYELDDNVITPAHEYEYGIDYVPTKRNILF